MEIFLQSLLNNRHKYQKELQQAISSFLYRKDRYSNEFSIVLIYIKNNQYNYEFEKIVRQTDKYIYFSSDLHCIILDETSSKSYIKAAENIQYSLQKLQRNIFYTATVSSEYHFLDAANMLSTLLDILIYAIRNNLSNIVVDSTILENYNHL